MKLHLDFETRSAADLNKVGAWAYAMHPTTEVTCMGIAGPDGKPTVYEGKRLHSWRWELPADDIISAHNAVFEYAIYNYILHKRYGWPARWDPALWRCTMARAAMCGLPMGLDELTRVLRCKTPKDLDGRRVMLELSKPTGFNVMGEPIFDETPAKYQRLYQYNASDVVAEIEVDSLLPELPPNEQKIWELDLVMNHRGIQIDLDLAAKAAKLSKDLVGPLNERLRIITNGQVDKATQIKALKAYLVANKVEVPYRYVDGEKKETLDKVGLTELLARPDLPPAVREAMEIRRQVNKTTSTAKYAKALDMVCPDGRVRGNLQYHGAHTGRWAGRLLQAQNFPQGYGADEEGATPEQDLAVACIKTGDVEMMEFAYGRKAMDALSNALRAMIIAAPGKVLISSDYNAIEARGVFWLAGETTALACYERGESPYLDMADYIYKTKGLTKKHKDEYAMGKRTILGCGFGMGWEKFRDNTYAETAKLGTPLRITDELAKTAVNGYREKYSAVPRMWKEIEAAAINAVLYPGKYFKSCTGKVTWGMSVDKRFLVCRLPSGRYLWYWKPAVIDSYRIFCKDPKCIHWEKMNDAVCPTRRDQKVLAYWGKNPVTGEWCPLTTYGGALTENVTQAVARDIMCHGMLGVEAAGFPMILTVHDEDLAEIDQLSEADEAGVGYKQVLGEFQKIMCDLPPWAAGFPVAVEGWIGNRYRK